MNKQLWLAAGLLVGSASVAAQDLRISAIFDGPLSGGVPKGIEIEVLNNISDLSVYGVGSATNGGASSGADFSFPQVAAVAGDYLYVTSQLEGFEAFFGFAADYESSAVNVNGDDVIELFYNGTAFDVYGVLGVDGSGQSWEYLDGWAARKAGALASTTFSESDWTFSGPNALDGESTNATATTPIPVSESAASSTAADLRLTAIFDGPLSGGVPKGIEIEVLNDIADLSIYGVGNSNNGADSSGVDFTFPQVAAVAGDYLYVTSQLEGFEAFFGFAADYESSVVNINGDDVVELFLNEVAFDVYGELGVDGTGQAWEYLDGWAVRNSGAAATTSFTISDWTFSGPNALDGESTNDTATTPIPISEGGSVGSDAALLISAVFDGPLSGGTPKGVELTVVADIADLSLYGLGSANNGGGTDGQEFTFPAVSASAGDYIYVASESVEFGNFFGFAPSYTSSAMGINGDDAVELFYDGAVIDLFGDINQDGTGTDWDHLDGWAARLLSAKPNTVFTLSEWVFSGTDALDGEATNATAATPVPIAGAARGSSDGGGDTGGETTEPTLQLISAIQGSPLTQGSNSFGETDVSPLVGQAVTIEGIVVGDFQDGDADTTRELSGFYVQEETSDEDGDPTTSEGIYVYDASFGVDVNVGDTVRVSGTVDQYYGETQIDTITAVTVVTAGNEFSLAQVTPATISLSMNTATSLDQYSNYQPDLEAYEGMLVTFSDTLTITEQFNLDRFNEIILVAGERPFQYSQLNAPSSTGYDAHLQALGARSITYDDGLNTQNELITNLVGFEGYTEASAPRMGDQTTDLAGVLDYKWAGNSSSGATWRVRAHLDGSVSFTSTANENSPNTRPETPSVSGDLSIASMNVLNFFTTLDDGSTNTAIGAEPRGADDLTGYSPAVTPASAEFDRQLAKLVQGIVALDADVLGLVEIENEFDATNDGSTAIETLVNELNLVAGTGTYDYVYPGSQFVGTDAIAVAFIYQTSSVSIAEGSTVAQLDDTQAASLSVFSGRDFADDPIFSGSNTSRVPLAVTFEHNASGDQFTAVVNHFKSKGGTGTGANEDLDDGAGSWNQRRLDAATAIDAWLETNPTGIDDADIAILGDLNAYAAEDPVQYLLSNGFNNVEDQDAYSYTFDGQLGTLDYLLVSDELFAKIASVAVWNINSDEADALDYNLDFGKSDTYFDATTATRFSDHDPVIAGFNLDFPQPPVANAGADQTVDEGLSVFLDGSASSDPEMTALSYAWIQVSGSSVTLTDADTAVASFTAPQVVVGGEQLVFSLTVTDGDSLSDSDQIAINVSNVPLAPFADAGEDQSPAEGTEVTLDASGSSDPEMGSLEYNWSQTSGSTVSLSATDVVAPTFTAPQVSSDGETLVFEVTVTDSDELTDSDQVSISVTDVPVAPIADAGADQALDDSFFSEEEAVVTLDGSASSDVDENISTYAWTQISGADVTLVNADAEIATFVVPEADDTLSFTLTVTDFTGLSSSDSVDVVVDVTVPQAVTAVPSLGQIRNASVIVTNLSGETIAGASGEIAADGSVALALPEAYSAPFIVEVQGDADAEYYDEASAAYVSLPEGESLRAVVASVQSSVGVTVLTEIAAARAVASGASTADDVQEINEAVADAFAPGISDITEVPTLIGSADDQVDSSDAGVYALYLASLSEIAADAGTDILSLSAQLSEDFSDGVNDDAVDGVAIENLVVSTTETSLSAQVSAVAETVVASYGDSSVSADDLQDAVDAVDDAIDDADDEATNVTSLGCSLGQPGGPFDPLIPLMAVFAMIWINRRKLSSMMS